MNVPDKGGRKHPRGDNIQIDTKYILFICVGAFVDLEKTISERRQDSSIAFGSPVRANMRSGGLIESVESADLTAYGLIPEFVGRLPVIVTLSALNEAQLVQVKLRFTDTALRLIAKKSMAKNTGALGLSALLESILTEAIFEIPDANMGEHKIDAVLVDEEAVGSECQPGCGAKIIRVDGALENILHETPARNDMIKTKYGEVELTEGALSSPILSAIGERYYKVTVEALRVCGELIRVVRPKFYDFSFDFKPYAHPMYNAIMSRLTSQDQDQEVKECAISCMGLVVSTFGDSLVPELPLVDRMGNEITRLTTVKRCCIRITLNLQLKLSSDEKLMSCTIKMSKNAN